MLTFRTVFQMPHDENIAPIATRDKTIAEVAIIINRTFPITTEASVKDNAVEILKTKVNHVIVAFEEHPKENWYMGGIPFKLHFYFNLVYKIHEKGCTCTI